jgi:hypothetical protein
MITCKGCGKEIVPKIPGNRCHCYEPVLSGEEVFDSVRWVAPLEAALGTLNELKEAAYNHGMWGWENEWMSVEKALRDCIETERSRGATEQS